MSGFSNNAHPNNWVKAKEISTGWGGHYILHGGDFSLHLSTLIPVQKFEITAW